MQCSSETESNLKYIFSSNVLDFKYVFSILIAYQQIYPKANIYIQQPKHYDYLPNNNVLADF